MPLKGLLAGKTAIITGGTTGIGRAICLGYLGQGCNVVVNHLGLEKDQAHLDSLIAEARAILAKDPEAGRLAHQAGDVREIETAARLVAAAVEHSGEARRLDICVSNAGVCTFADFLTLSPDLLETTFRTNVDGAFYITQAAARQMALNQSPSGGSIIGMSSISALVGGGLQTHYTPTKAGVTSLMQSTAVALGKYGIRCNALLPGTIRTQLNEEDLADDAKRNYMEGRIPLGRTGQPADMAGPAIFLACEELSGYVTGAQLLVDGGLFLRLLPLSADIRVPDPQPRFGPDAEHSQASVPERWGGIDVTVEPPSMSTLVLTCAEYGEVLFGCIVEYLLYRIASTRDGPPHAANFNTDTPRLGSTEHPEFPQTLSMVR
ncbi:hypothetical protein MKX08_004308 [Trichoderma sp. CBMAI-0020]|nr:hypothetical protein MKX08_004308 [Trichoderma sp. CBMAI-0020]